MKKSAQDAAEFLKVLANPTRLMIVCRLIEGEASVGEIAEMLGMRPSTVSQHLQVLRLCSMVETRREAQTIYYSLAHNPSQDVVKVLYKNYCMDPQPRRSKSKSKKNGESK